MTVIRGWGRSLLFIIIDTMTIFTEIVTGNKTAQREAVKDYAMVKDNGSTDIAEINYSLLLDTETSVYVYFKPADGYSISLTD